MDKNSGAIVIHLPKDKETQFQRLAERDGLSKSQLGRELIDRFLEQHRNDYEFMKSVFESFD